MILDTNKILESLINLNPEPIRESAAPELVTPDSNEIPPALIYIPFITQNKKLPKFHFMTCDIVIKMFEEGRLERYRLSCRTDGIFTMSDDKQYKLEVCYACLKNFAKAINKPLNYIKKEFGRDKNFNIAKLFNYLERTGKRFIDSETWANLKMGVILKNDYPEHGQNISSVNRALKRYKCEKCGADLSGRKNLLHVHHINGVKSDINPRNLIVLCKICHSEEPMHKDNKKLQPTESERDYILLHRPERKTQKLAE